MKKIRIGIVNYLNTRPLLYGIERSDILNEVELIGDYPSAIADSLINGSIDMGLVPVAIIPSLKEYHLNTDYCIGCDGAVASVCLFSDVPLQQVDTVLLDYQSRTSVELAKILLREYWKISPLLLDTAKDYRKQIKGKTAGLVIGDRSFEQRRESPYVYDLGQAWKEHTGLPFVFAAWISNRELDANLIKRFNQANAEGLSKLDCIIAKNPYELFDLKRYYTEYISYYIDGKKKQGLDLFLTKLKNDKSSVINMNADNQYGGNIQHLS